MRKIYSFLLLGLLLSIGNVWAAFEKASSIAVGDQVVFVYETGTMELTGISSTSTPYGVGIEYTTTPAGTWIFDVVAGSATNTFAFKNGDNYLAWSSGNSLKVSSTLDSNSSWTVTFGNGNATILNAKDSSRKLQWNVGNPRFACYTSSQKAIQLYKKVNASVAAPVFSPAEGSFFETQNVSITCPTSGAAIYYTLDGSDPTSESTPYSNPIEVSETKTIKAIAIVGNESSSIASATYTIVTPKTIAEVRAQETGSVFTQGIVTSSSSDGKTVYIQDASAGVVIYSTSDLSLTVGDEITVKGTLSSYHNLLEITSPVVNVLSQGNSVSPAVKTIAEINADNTYSLQGLLIKIENAKVSEINEQNVTLVQSANTIVVRFANASDVTTAGIAVDDVISLVGNIGCYNGAQIANPTDVQIEAPVAVPSIDVEETSINATAEETEGTITVTYNNITNVAAEVIFYNAQGDEVPASTYSWIAAEINDQTNNVDYVIVANTSDERTAYMKVYALDDATNDVYSEIITINQAAYVAPAHGSSADDPFSVAEVLAGTATGSNVYVKGYIVGEYVGKTTAPRTSGFSGNSNIALADAYTESPAVANCIPVELPNNPASIRTNWGLKNTNGAKVGYEVIVLANCTTYFSTNGVKGTSQITPVSMDITIGSTGYATYYNSTEAYFMPEGCTGYGFTFENGLETLAAYVPGEDVPANEPLVIVGTPGVKTLEFTTSIVDPIAAIGANDLLGTDTETTLTADADYYFYGLSLNSASAANSVGFYWMAEGGAAFKNGAHKAYLKLAKTLFADPNQAPSRILFNENNATNIQNVEGNEKAVKFMENGQLYILKNGVVYDAMGKTVR